MEAGHKSSFLLDMAGAAPFAVAFAVALVVLFVAAFAGIVQGFRKLAGFP